MFIQNGFERTRWKENIQQNEKDDLKCKFIVYGCGWQWVAHFGLLNDSPNLTFKKCKPLRDNFHHQKNSKHISSWIYAYIKTWMKGTTRFEQVIKISKHLINIHDEQYQSSRMHNSKWGQILWKAITKLQTFEKKKQWGSHFTYAIEANNKVVNYPMPKYQIKWD